MRGLARLKRCQPGVHFPRAEKAERGFTRGARSGAKTCGASVVVRRGGGGSVTVSERVGEHGWWIFLWGREWRCGKRNKRWRGRVSSAFGSGVPASATPPSRIWYSPPHASATPPHGTPPLARLSLRQPSPPACRTPHMPADPGTVHLSRSLARRHRP